MNCKCPDCNWSGETSDLEPLGIDVFQRLEAGDTFPNGQCPECDALVCVPDPLIDAAPDLLNALESLLSIGKWDGFVQWDEWEEVIAARAAIAKAKGGAK